MTSKTSYWDGRSHRIYIVEKYNQENLSNECTLYGINKIESQSQTASNLQFVKTIFVMIMFVMIMFVMTMFVLTIVV